MVEVHHGDHTFGPSSKEAVYTLPQYERSGASVPSKDSEPIRGYVGNFLCRGSQTLTCVIKVDGHLLQNTVHPSQNLGYWSIRLLLSRLDMPVRPSLPHLNSGVSDFSTKRNWKPKRAKSLLRLLCDENNQRGFKLRWTSGPLIFA